MGATTIKYFMTAEGFQKVTCLAPCPIWFMKVSDPSKSAMFSSGRYEKTLEFTNAQLGCMRHEAMKHVWSASLEAMLKCLRCGSATTVHLSLPFVRLEEKAGNRKQAKIQNMCWDSF